MMTQTSIEEVKFEEAKKLVQELISIGTFNKNISIVASVGLNSAEELTSVSAASGSRKSLLMLYSSFTEALVKILMEDHNCECNIFALVESAAEGATKGYNDFKKKEKEKIDENN
ncbi:hypothetical protein ACY4RH_000536 [Listeria monocytogenes]|nr:hypothetical protein [Listeria monocytogenes]